MQDIRLVYSSVARAGLDLGHIKGILREARAHNTAAGLTGMLCFGDGQFLQVLEGGRSAVSRIYNKIILDSRHTDAEVLESCAISARDFPKWSMKLVAIEGTARRALLPPESPNFDPRSMTGPRAMDFLRALVELERGAPESVTSAA